MNRTLNTLQKAFLLRSCSDSVFCGRSRPCMLYQLKRCSAPCTGLVGDNEYNALVADADVILGLELTDFWGTVNAYRDQQERSSRRITKSLSCYQIIKSLPR